MQTPSADDTGKNDFFFDNPTRAALRQEIMAAIIDGVPFLVLTGPDGSGKTTLISRLTNALPAGVKSLVISQGMDGCRRFEDVLLRICRRIAPETAWDDHANTQQVQRVQEEIRDHLTQKNIRLLLILDQAEQAFLAMLERVRKMLDTVNSSGVRMQLFLVGQEILLTNIKPLGLVQFAEIPERYFTLPLLAEDDLPHFLGQWLQSAAPDIHEDAISERHWREICAEAAGKPGVLSALLTERIDSLTGGKATSGKATSSKTTSEKAVSGKTASGKTTSGKAAKTKAKANTSEANARRRSQPKQVVKPKPLPAPDAAIRNLAAQEAKRRRAASRRRLRVRLRRKNALFWGKLNREARRLMRRIAHGLVNLARGSGQVAATIFRACLDGATGLSRLMARAAGALFHGIGAALHGIGRSLSNLLKFMAQMLAALGHATSRGAGGLLKLLALAAQAIGAAFASLAGIISKMGKSSAGMFVALGHAIASLPWAKTWQIPARLFLAMGTAIIGAGAACAAGCRRLAQAPFQTVARKMANRKAANHEAANHGRLSHQRKTAVPSGTLKKAALALAALCLAVWAGATLWQGSSHPPLPDVEKQDKPPLVAETGNQPSEKVDEKTTVAPKEEAAGKGSIPTGTVIVEMPTPTQPPAATTAPAVKPEPRPAPKPALEPVRPEPARPEPAPPEVVKITADKVKKEIKPEPAPKPEPKPEPPKPIHIARTEAVEKITPQPTTVAKPEPAKPEPAKPEPAKPEPAKTGKPAKTGEVSEPPVKKAETPRDDGAYNAGLSAGKRWTSGKNSGQYTVQVMTTSPKEAQALVASLASQHASRVTIVPAGANRVTIFYGDYPSMTEARQARGALPAALRQGGNPYAISVDGAMGRLKAAQ